MKQGEPYRYLAVVHDLDRDPSCRAIWILAALASLKQELQHHTNVRSLAMPLLGVRHGPLSIMESLNLMLQAMDGERWALDRLWLQVPRADLPVVHSFLEEIKR